MDTKDMLKAFALSQNINVKEVDKFLSQFENVKTLKELRKTPKSIREDIDYITWVKEPLKSFIEDEMWCERHMTIDLEDIVDCLYDRIYNLLDDENPDLDIDEVGVENLTTENEDNKEELEGFIAVAKSLVDQSFNSVVYDW